MTDTSLPTTDHGTSCQAELPAPLWRVAAFAVVALAAGTVLAVWLQASGSPRLSGYLAASTTPVKAERAGIVTALHIREAEHVTIGEQLLSLADVDLQSQLEAKQGEIASLEAEHSRACSLARLELEWRLKDVEADITETQLRSANYLKEKFDYELQKTMLADVLASAETAMWNDGNSAFEALMLKNRLPRDERISTVLQMEAAANAAEVSNAQVELCDRRIKDLEQLRARLPDVVRGSTGVDVFEARLAHARQELAALESRQTSLTVVSPAVGTVGLFRKQVGDFVAPGETIVELLDGARRSLTVEVPSTYIADFTIGQELALLFPGHEGRHGRVVRIAPQAGPRHDPGSMADTVIDVTVEQAGEVWPQLPIGARVEVQIAE